ncbi:hypothetical protein ACS0TY_016053 [Phlomoides rotata]
MYAVQTLRTKNPMIPWRLISRWHKAREKITGMQLTVSHIYREGNAAVERLTKDQVFDVTWWPEAPDVNRIAIMSFIASPTCIR